MTRGATPQTAWTHAQGVQVFKTSRWARFASVGMIGFAVQLTLVHLLTSVVGLDYRVAIVFAVEAAILHNFVWHERWTWRDRIMGSSRQAAYARFVKFNTASGLISIVGNVFFTAVFVELAGAPVLAANVAAIACLTILNFFAADRLAFAPATRGRARPIVAFALAVLGTAFGGRAQAAELKPETVKAWEQYVRGVEARIRQDVAGTGPFLSVDVASPSSSRHLRSTLRRGDIILENVGDGTIDIGDGTISHWRGYLFVPGVSVEDLLDGAALRGAAVKHRQEDVLESRVLSREGDSLRLFLKVRRTAIVTAAYNTEHSVSYTRLSTTRALSRSISTRIAELQDVGTSYEREKPVGHDRGFMWRLHSYWRYEAVEGGVIVQLDSVTLSRDIPWAIRVMAAPIIDRIARESMNRTLDAVRARYIGPRSTVSGPRSTAHGGSVAGL
jgi:putative flippase GtrA